jgi:quercetin dioxygenase-like cupin family protein
MDIHRPDDRLSQESDGVSRRTVVLFGAGGLTTALFALQTARAHAQEATPSPGGMPAGVEIAPGVTVNVTDMPPAPVAVAIYRLTIEPGGVSPVSTFPFPSIIVIEQGTLICPGGAPRYFITPDGTTTEYGDEEIVLTVGEALYVPANVPDGARNDGTEQVIVLAVDLMPGGDMATPTA